MTSFSVKKWTADLSRFNNSFFGVSQRQFVSVRSYIKMHSDAQTHTNSLFVLRLGKSSDVTHATSLPDCVCVPGIAFVWSIVFLCPIVLDVVVSTTKFSIVKNNFEQ